MEEKRNADKQKEITIGFMTAAVRLYQFRFGSYRMLSVCCEMDEAVNGGLIGAGGKMNVKTCLVWNIDILERRLSLLLICHLYERRRERERAGGRLGNNNERDRDRDAGRRNDGASVLNLKRENHFYFIL
jgi:hypothetical protein